MDSNHRSRKTADLQSAPFGHSGTHPRVHIPRTATQLRCIGKSLGCSALKITNLTFVQFLILVPYYHVNDQFPSGEREPLVGLEPTTAGLQI